MSTENSQVEPLLLSPQQAGEMLGIGRTQLYKMVADKELKSVKIGRLRRIPASEVRRYVQSLMGETED